MCLTSRPRSRISVLRPLSQNSFAAQPPLAPEPMTMASYVLFLAESARWNILCFYIDTSIVVTRYQLEMLKIHHHFFGSIKSANGFRLHQVEEFSFFGIG